MKMYFQQQTTRCLSWCWSKIDSLVSLTLFSFLLFFLLHFLKSLPTSFCHHNLWQIHFVCVCLGLRLCVCARAHQPQKSLSFSSLAFSTVSKSDPSPCCLSAAHGGAGVGLPGHVSAPPPPTISQRAVWLPAWQNSLCLSEERCESTTVTTPMWKSYGNEADSFKLKFWPNYK